MNIVDVSLYLIAKIKQFAVHSNESARDYILWNRWRNDIDLQAASIVVVDFSEHLSLPRDKEPQALY